MRNLILLLIKNGGLILFLFLEGLCMFLVVQFNKKQNQIYFSSSAVISGAVYGQFDEVAKYWNLSEVMDSLSRENAQLYEKLEFSKLIQRPWQDTTHNQETQQMFTYIPAKVLSSTVASHNNYLTIELGSKHNIRPGMGVIGNSGIVGVTTGTTTHLASVMSILHKESHISASIRRTNYHGFLTWQGSNPTRATLIDVPSHANLTIGDTIQTSGYSTIFPAGIMIGTVEKIDRDPGSNFYTIEVKLKNDLSSIRYVYVVNNLLKEELNQLEEEKKDE